MSHTTSGSQTYCRRCNMFFSAAWRSYCPECGLALIPVKPQGEALSDEPVTQPEVPYGHAMLPNDSHPGAGCSCADCLRNHK